MDCDDEEVDLWRRVKVAREGWAVRVRGAKAVRVMNAMVVCMCVCRNMNEWIADGADHP